MHCSASVTAFGGKTSIMSANAATVRSARTTHAVPAHLATLLHAGPDDVNMAAAGYIDTLKKGNKNLKKIRLRRQDRMTETLEEEVTKQMHLVVPIFDTDPYVGGYRVGERISPLHVHVSRVHRRAAAADGREFRDFLQLTASWGLFGDMDDGNQLYVLAASGGLDTSAGDEINHSAPLCVCMHVWVVGWVVGICV